MTHDACSSPRLCCSAKPRPPALSPRLASPRDGETRDAGTQVRRRKANSMDGHRAFHRSFETPDDILGRPVDLVQVGARCPLATGHWRCASSSPWRRERCRMTTRALRCMRCVAALAAQSQGHSPEAELPGPFTSVLAQCAQSSQAVHVLTRSSHNKRLADCASQEARTPGHLEVRGARSDHDQDQLADRSTHPAARRALIAGRDVPVQSPAPECAEASRVVPVSSLRWCRRRMMSRAGSEPGGCLLPGGAYCC